MKFNNKADQKLYDERMAYCKGVVAGNLIYQCRSCHQRFELSVSDVRSAFNTLLLGKSWGVDYYKDRDNCSVVHPNMPHLCTFPPTVKGFGFGEIVGMEPVG